MQPAICQPLKIHHIEFNEIIPNLGELISLNVSSSMIPVSLMPEKITWYCWHVSRVPSTLYLQLSASVWWQPRPPPLRVSRTSLPEQRADNHTLSRNYMVCLKIRSYSSNLYLLSWGQKYMTLFLKILNEISLTESVDAMTSVFGDPSSFSSTKLTGAPFSMLHKVMWTFKTRRRCLISPEWS